MRAPVGDVAKATSHRDFPPPVGNFASEQKAVKRFPRKRQFCTPQGDDF
jgi:hypothetical protein